MPIIRRNNCIYATLGTRYSVWMTVCYTYRITSTKCRINTVVSPNDGHIVARNMYRKEINILRKTVHQVGSIYKKKYVHIPSFYIYIYIFFFFFNVSVYQSSFDFIGWFWLKRKSRKTFDIVSTKICFFYFAWGRGAVGRHLLSPRVRQCTVCWEASSSSTTQ